jgi:hypothetical protein
MSAKYPLRVSLMLVVISTLVCFSGCIEWERQILRYRHDSAGDRLLIFQDFQGIYGADNTEGLTDSEIKELESVLAGDRTFFFANWILELNLKAARDLVEDLRFKAADSVAEEELNQKTLTTLQLLCANASIANGGLYLNSLGQLSGTQRVQLNNFSKILSSVEDALRAYYKFDAQRADGDADRQAYYNTVRAEDWRFFSIVGNQLSVKFPLSATEFAKQFKNIKSPALKRAGISVSHSDGLARLSVGKARESITTVELDSFEKSYRGNAHEYLQSRESIPKSFDAAGAARKFLAPPN